VHHVLHHHFFNNDSWLQKLDHSCQERSFSANDGQKLRNFKLFWRLYVYNPERGTFDPVPAMPLHLPRQIRRALESLRFINTAGTKIVRHAVTVLQACAHFAFAALLNGLTPSHGRA